MTAPVGSSGDPDVRRSSGRDASRLDAHGCLRFPVQAAGLHCRIRRRASPHAVARFRTNRVSAELSGIVDRVSGKPVPCKVGSVLSKEKREWKPHSNDTGKRRPPTCGGYSWNERQKKGSGFPVCRVIRHGGCKTGTGKPVFQRRHDLSPNGPPLARFGGGGFLSATLSRPRGQGLSLSLSLPPGHRPGDLFSGMTTKATERLSAALAAVEGFGAPSSSIEPGDLVAFREPRTDLARALVALTAELLYQLRRADPDALARLAGVVEGLCRDVKGHVHALSPEARFYFGLETHLARVLYRLKGWPHVGKDTSQDDAGTPPVTR